VIGALTAQSREANAFHTEDVEVLQTLADQLAVAIDNASLFNEVQTANVQLRQMDSLKTQFLANMSHELRTPLNSIIGFSRLMLKGIDGPVTTEQVEDLSSIHTSGQHLLRLINDILDMSKIEAGKMALAFSKVNLEEIGSTVISSVEPLLEGKPVEIVLNIEAGLPEIDADAIKVRQVMINLLSNAVKFTERGAITLSMRQHDDENVLVTVQDSGKGIAKDDYDALFRPFEQLDASPTREIGGTGLGLPISRNLVVLHGGDLWVESELGVGSTFYMTLPIFQTESVVEATLV
jgi:signal transduction histidine kinase